MYKVKEDRVKRSSDKTRWLLGCAAGESLRNNLHNNKTDSHSVSFFFTQRRDTHLLATSMPLLDHFQPDERSDMMALDDNYEDDAGPMAGSSEVRTNNRPVYVLLGLGLSSFSRLPACLEKEKRVV